MRHTSVGAVLEQDSAGLAVAHVGCDMESSLQLVVAHVYHTTRLFPRPLPSALLILHRPLPPHLNPLMHKRGEDESEWAGAAHKRSSTHVGSTQVVEQTNADLMCRCYGGGVMRRAQCGERREDRRNNNPLASESPCKSDMPAGAGGT